MYFKVERDCTKKTLINSSNTVSLAPLGQEDKKDQEQKETEENIGPMT